MKKYHYIILVYFLLERQDAQGGRTRHKYTHQKDVSEYCRRRVLPSVFLGRHVLDANSQVLHFSRLELPYSCSLSVRAESGSNIIVVIQLLSEYSLTRSCTEDNHQLLVYEIGETFGGYWGPLPDSIMRQEVKTFTQFYTLQSTERTTTIDNSSDYTSVEEDSEENTETVTQKSKITTTDDYIEMELPLVNISGNFTLDVARSERVDDLLKALNDVTVRDGLNYDTKILPLLQFSMLTPNFSAYDDLTTVKKYVSKYRPRVYTPDPRLNFRTINRRRHFNNKRKYSSSLTNRKHSFKKELYTFKAKTLPRIVSTNRNNNLSMSFTNQITNRRTKPREIIEQIIKSLSHTTDDFKTTNILTQNVLDSHQNISAYLVPETFTLENKSLGFYDNENNVSNDFTNSAMTIKNLQSHQNFSAANEFESNISILKTINNSLNIEETTAIEPYLISVSKKIYPESLSDRDTKINDSSYSKMLKHRVIPETSSNDYTMKQITNSQLQTGSMVNHESWENVVQIAPVMAVLLNQTVPQVYLPTVKKVKKNITTVIEMDKVFNTSFELKNRKRRYLEPLEIKNAKPRVLTTAKNRFNTRRGVDDFVDVQDISHLVELKDDEMHGRVALRYMRNYVGSTLFNICDYADPKLRHVYLFNTSRLVISISNFTMEQMTLILTPAKVLKSKETNCPLAHLECQISGARVCIDSMTACDGVPNCGTYDIYDEDRLLCGKVNNMRHNVYLAACTFLAVLLTLLYIVHYWLKRCVPQVSEAFFLYADRSENILNLESIMHSPHEEDDGSKMVYDGHYVYDESLDIENEEDIKESLFKKLWKFCLVWKLNKGSRDKVQNDDNASQDSTSHHPPAKRLFSFAELELSRIASKRATDACIQTGDSFKDIGLNEIKSQNPNQKPLLSSTEYIKYKKEMEELSILKFLKESRSNSIKSVSFNESFNSVQNSKKIISYNVAVDEERELLNTLYEPEGSSARKHDHQKVVASADIHSENIEISLQKRLRFDEEATTIPSMHDNDENVEEEGSNSKTQVILGTEKLRCSETVGDADEEANSAGRDFIRFWTGAKGTKSKKKKKHVTLQ